MVADERAALFFGDEQEQDRNNRPERADGNPAQGGLQSIVCRNFGVSETFHFSHRYYPPRIM